MREYGIPNAVRDENLRLVLAQEEKQFIVTELAHARQVVFASLAVLCTGIVIMAALAFAFSFQGEAGIALFGVGAVTVTLVSAGFIAAYLKHRRFLKYERDFRAFLSKYNRTWESL
ncbi:MAG: hypothetical protein MI741_20595 [Rhodospirillales bacterium]|nr:hypothetical protein [Rhodospirillales bacterium]